MNSVEVKWGNFHLKESHVRCVVHFLHSLFFILFFFILFLFILFLFILFSSFSFDARVDGFEELEGKTIDRNKENETKNRGTEGQRFVFLFIFIVVFFFFFFIFLRVFR